MKIVKRYRNIFGATRVVQLDMWKKRRAGLLLHLDERRKRGHAFGCLWLRAGKLTPFAMFRMPACVMFMDKLWENVGNGDSKEFEINCF